jgi:hypothetical protein
VSWVKYRQILYCGFNHQFVKPEKMGISNHVKEEGKGEFRTILPS